MPDSLTDLGGLTVAATDFLAAILQAAAQPIWVVDPDGRIRFANPAAIAALGYDRAEELFGCHSHETIHYAHPDGSPYPASECPMLLPRSTGETVARDLDWFFRRDGSVFPVSYVSVPIDMPNGRGAVVAFTDIEDRRRTEQVVRERDAVLAAQLDALRRMATLAAGGASSAEVFAAVTREVARVLDLPMAATYRYDADGTVTAMGAWSDRSHPLQAGTRWPVDYESLPARVLRTRRPVRIDDLAEPAGPIADALGAVRVRSCVGVPIIVDGRVWGMMVAAAGGDEPLPERIEDRLAAFTELVATAISNSQARDELRQLADEQAALRRVATIVAEGATPADVFAAVAREIALLLALPVVTMYRYEPDATATVNAAIGDHPFRPGTNWPLDGPSLVARVRSGRPARVEDYADVPGTLGETACRAGFQSGVGAPIVVDGKVWGSMVACSVRSDPVPPDAESRLSQFTALVATAISNTEAREDLRRLADEQAALRRLATLVARGAEPPVVFDAVCKETGRVLGASSVNLAQFTSDGFNLTVAGWSVRDVHVPAGTRLPLTGDAINVLVHDTAAPGRRDSYEGASGELAGLIRRLGIRSEVGAPVVIEGGVWGALIAGTDEPDPLPAGTERRLASFAELIATAVANADARTELVASRARIVEAADEQRRRVVRDLHDGAQQRLVHTVVTLKLARAALGAAQRGVELVDEALDHAQQATKELRELAHGILPAALTRGGLRTGLEALAARSSVPVALDVPASRFPASAEATVYFVVAEALTNVSKHAQARRAQVSVTIADGSLTVRVRDDGVGGAHAGGPGLVGMRDRLAALEGELQVDSPPGGGTVLTAAIPLRD